MAKQEKSQDEKKSQKSADLSGLGLFSGMDLNWNQPH